MLKELKNSGAVPRGQRNALMPCDDLFGSRQCSPHHKAREVQAFVGGGRSEKALLFARSAQLDTLSACCGSRGLDEFPLLQ